MGQIALKGRNRMPIYIVTRPETWAVAKVRGYFYEDSIASEGFIHASAWPQLNRVLTHYFGNAQTLLVLMVDPVRLRPPVRWELSRSNGDVYPHIYGILNLDAASVALTLSRNAEGRFELPALEPTLQTAGP